MGIFDSTYWTQKLWQYNGKYKLACRVLAGIQNRGDNISSVERLQML